MSSQRLITVDPSLTCSGWALFGLPKGELLGVGKIRAMSGERPLAARLDDLQKKVAELYAQIRLGQGDVLVSEAPTTMRDPRAALVVEQVRCIFEILGRSRGVAVPGRINPRSVQHEILRLHGKQCCRVEVKAAAVAAVGHLYGRSLAQTGFDYQLSNLKRNQDVVDAILVGALALTRIAGAGQAGLELTAVFDEQTAVRRRIRRRIRREAA